MGDAPSGARAVRDAAMTDRQARDLPLDAHMHTDLSPDSNVPIDVYAAAAVERGIAEIAITDHVDFEPGAPAFGYATFADRERIVRDAAERWGPQGVRDPVRGRAHLRPGLGGRHPRPPRPPRLRLHDRLGPRPGGLAVQPAQRGGLGRRPLARRDRRAVVRRGRRGCPVRAVRRHRPHRRASSATSTRTSCPAAFEAAPELYEPILRALVESGTALEVNTSGLRYAIGGHVPARRRSWPASASSVAGR